MPNHFPINFGSLVLATDLTIVPRFDPARNRKLRVAEASARK
jgi:hypothetical protein